MTKEDLALRTSPVFYLNQDRMLYLTLIMKKIDRNFNILLNALQRNAYIIAFYIKILSAFKKPSEKCCTKLI